MKKKKADWILLNEAEEAGMLAPMTSLTYRKIGEKAKKMGAYFQSEIGTYTGNWDEDESDDLLDALNDYIKEHSLDVPKLDFPNSGGTETVLLPITPNLALKLLIVDEYHGSGEYSKYVMADFFLITEETSVKDVNELINVINTRMKI